jgi:hypothetical protein
MTSDRQIAANRRNAARSTGPTTAQGKARASRNSWRHGLSRPAIGSPEVAEEVEALARDLVGCDAASSNELGLARAAAEGQIEIMRVRRERARLTEAVIAQASGVCGSGRKETTPAAIGRLGRYERRAETRRNRALVQLVASTRGLLS